MSKNTLQNNLERHLKTKFGKREQRNLKRLEQLEIDRLLKNSAPAHRGLRFVLVDTRTSEVLAVKTRQSLLPVIGGEVQPAIYRVWDCPRGLKAGRKWPYRPCPQRKPLDPRAPGCGRRSRLDAAKVAALREAHATELRARLLREHGRARLTHEEHWTLARMVGSRRLLPVSVLWERLDKQVGCE